MVTAAGRRVHLMPLQAVPMHWHQYSLVMCECATLQKSCAICTTTFRAGKLFRSKHIQVQPCYDSSTNPHSHKLWSLPVGVSLHLLDASWYLPKTARKDAAVQYGLTTRGTNTPSDKDILAFNQGHSAKKTLNKKLP